MIATTAPAKRAPTRRRHGVASVLASCGVLAVTLGFYGYAASVAHPDRGHTYPLEATFLSSNGLSAGADVLIAGVPVGAVTAITLDTQAMVSHVRFRIDQSIHLPMDSRLSIGSPGLTAANALMIEPGHSKQRMKADGVLTDTCEAVSLEDQVSRYIFGNGGAATGC